jgi:6-phosphogluconolactonase
MRLVPALIFVIVLAIGSQRSMTRAAEGRLRVYFGTFAEGAHAGIFVAEMDLGSGVVSEPRLAAAAGIPAFVAVAPDRKQLYAVSEVSVFEGKKSGGVVARTIDPSTGRLTLLNEELSQGTHPCHIVVDKAGKNVLVV